MQQAVLEKVSTVKSHIIVKRLNGESRHINHFYNHFDFLDTLFNV